MPSHHMRTPCEGRPQLGSCSPCRHSGCAGLAAIRGHLRRKRRVFALKAWSRSSEYRTCSSGVQLDANSKHPVHVVWQLQLVAAEAWILT